MKTIPCKLVTIIAEEDLEERLVADLKRLGATGYTIVEVRGEGEHGLRGGRGKGANIQIETLVGDEIAEAILLHLSEQYFGKHAIVLYVTDADVIRGAKYSPGNRAGGSGD